MSRSKLKRHGLRRPSPRCGARCGVSDQGLPGAPRGRVVDVEAQDLAERLIKVLGVLAGVIAAESPVA